MCEWPPWQRFRPESAGGIPLAIGATTLLARTAAHRTRSRIDETTDQLNDRASEKGIPNAKPTHDGRPQYGDRRGRYDPRFNAA